ncbi:Polyphosphoinositide phosphatase [Smittium culicis]|uniref:Polyphosphoinositide phosphatase n=1 Tax=Smittium culicis TaxID=133412 RepID=A0A1R1XS30_9FUNG|nr:Polyphosphoinositide phosphatase [Smittium culicis]
MFFDMSSFVPTETVSIYTALNKYYFVLRNNTHEYYRLLKIEIDETHYDEPVVVDDGVFYDDYEYHRLISDISSSYVKFGGLIQIVSKSPGVIGFVKFTKGYYVSVIIDYKIVALVGGHYIHHIEKAKLIPLFKKNETCPKEERNVYVILIARRSRVFAGVRFMKRGVNEKGYVANDVETEQIIHTMDTTSFDLPYLGKNSNPSYTSFVQHRGSIPLFWSQDTSAMNPKPPIEREEFTECINYLNKVIDERNKLLYIRWDMSRAKNNREDDVLEILEEIAEESLSLTGFFHNGPELYTNFVKHKNMFDAQIKEFKKDPSSSATFEFDEPIKRNHKQFQNGVVRSNCIDCLDRTNTAQYIIGKVAAAHQLYALGLINEPYLAFDTDAIFMLEAMYHDLGDTIALQYGGSELVNTVKTYRNNNNWTSHSRDMIVSIKRYYSNSFVDAERQNAITMFLEKSDSTQNDDINDIIIDADDPFHSNDIALGFLKNA